jgi:hypothetical protein
MGPWFRRGRRGDRGRRAAPVSQGSDRLAPDHPVVEGLRGRRHPVGAVPVPVAAGPRHDLCVPAPVPLRRAGRTASDIGFEYVPEYVPEFLDTAEFAPAEQRLRRGLPDPELLARRLPGAGDRHRRQLRDQLNVRDSGAPPAFRAVASPSTPTIWPQCSITWASTGSACSVSAAADHMCWPSPAGIPTGSPPPPSWSGCPGCPTRRPSR